MTKKKCYRVENENLKITQALSSKTDSHTANSIFLKDSSHFESETSGEKFSPCLSNAFMQLLRKILQSQTLTQIAAKEACPYINTSLLFMNILYDSKIFLSCFECSQLVNAGNHFPFNI